MPEGLRNRIRDAAEANNRSMNAEIVASLEEKYPPKSIDVKVLAEFLASMHGVSAPDGDHDYLDQINSLLAQADQPWSVVAGWDGAVTFYPVAETKRSRRQLREAQSEAIVADDLTSENEE